MSQSAWIDGKLLTFEEANLDSAGWPQDEGIFETIKTVNSQPWALSRHMRRSLNTCRRNSQPFPSEEAIRMAVSEVIAANPFPVGRLRLLFGSDGSLRATHHEYFELTEPAKLNVRTVPGMQSGIVEKRFPYSRNLALLADAKSSGFDDSLLVNENGFISETTISNLVFNLDGEWITPPLSDGVLPGVMRALLIEKSGVLVRQIPVNMLSEVSDGFVVSSLKIAQPIGSIEDRRMQNSLESEQMRSVFEATALATSVG